MVKDCGHTGTGMTVFPVGEDSLMLCSRCYAVVTQPWHDKLRETSDALAEAKRENAELRADRERLEWLLQNERIYQPYLMNDVEYSRKLFTREHIDAARREETEREARRGE